MNRKLKVAALSILFGIAVSIVGSDVSSLLAQQQGGGNQTSGGVKPAQEGLVTDWLNDFEDCEDWRAVPTCPLGETKIRKYPGKPRPLKDGQPVNENGEPGEFANETTEEDTGIVHKNSFVLGVKTYFMDRGFDRVEVMPPNEYIIRGRAKEVKIWVLGRKFRHTLFVKLRDYKGNTHKIKMGRLDFWGWREMSAIVPGWLPQMTNYAVMDRNLHFVSFFVEHDRFEAPGPFYFYLDQFRVITDLSEFTGDEYIRDNW
ncbi:MAG: flagellar filament outer layer protein FlaA [Leptospirales bacterium]|nr:flagellar filament outer layer protein FlaA [Leptospirales bacterium]